MSLINDALKRASRAQPPPAPPTGTPMTPAEEPRPPQWPVVLVPVLLLGVVTVAAWFLWSAAKLVRPSLGSAPPQRVAAREPVPPAATASLPFATALSQTVAVGQQISSRQATAESALPSATLAGGASNLPSPHPPTAGAGPIPTNPPPTTEPPKPTAPPLKLKAIFYRPSNPSVVINTKTLFLGDKIGGARVVAIDQESVTLLSNGQTNVLTLE